MRLFLSISCLSSLACGVLVEKKYFGNTDKRHVCTVNDMIELFFVLRFSISTFDSSNVTRHHGAGGPQTSLRRPRWDSV